MKPCLFSLRSDSFVKGQLKVSQLRKLNCTCCHEDAGQHKPRSEKEQESVVRMEQWGTCLLDNVRFHREVRWAWKHF